ncbi:tumor necrosis factor receptor superfamily member 11A isoform X3 [Anguilla rostrata]|uniref:tumor necrosis factor receptor superfamily member 11A isoform X3 n=1 Tax=Anguilla rostrata TaxID=7938 RepID=UPI0030CFF42D
MRVDFTISWILRGWVTHLIVTLCAQAASKPNCNQHQYVKDKMCCSKCAPGKYVFLPCKSDSDTTCRDCGSNEYQPDWNNETKCLSQKFCDTGKGFSRVRPQNRLAAVPCQCRPGFQCYLSNCEFCEKIKSCPSGYGLTTENFGRGSCKPCEHGHFSNESSIEPCRPWTSCKELGKTEKQPGSDTTDAVCGPLIAGTSTPWVVVAVLSVIVIISSIILFLFCYKDRLEPLSENLRTCVQNLKRSRIQQETSLAPFSSSHGPQNGTLYEVTCLISQEDNVPKSLNTCPDDRLANGDSATARLDQEEGPGGPCDEALGGVPSPLPSSSSCSCMLSTKEPMEVGENEDCSQAVATGLTRACSCGGDSGTGGGNLLQETSLCNGCSTCSLSACSRCANRHGSCDACLDFCGRAAKASASENKGGLCGSARADGDHRQNEPCCCSIDSTTVPMLSSDSDNEEDGSQQEKLSVRDLSLELDTESSSHTSDLPLASGHVMGNSNTTFISNGQVMNFSGDVIVVYVSQNSESSGGGPGEDFCSPVQEESSEEDFQGIAKPKMSTVPPEDVPHPLQEETHQQSATNHMTLPVQEKPN